MNESPARIGKTPLVSFATLGSTNPAMAFFLAMLLFSLAGIPPLAGFFAKFYVFLAAIKAGLYTLAVIGVLASVVGAYYYLLIVKVMYFDEPAQEFDACQRTAGRARRDCRVQSPVHRLPGAPRQCGGGGREIAVLMQLDPAALAAGTRVRIEAFDTLGSTNAEALARARAGERGPCGSRRGARPPAAAAGPRRGSPSRAISMRACC